MSSEADRDTGGSEATGKIRALLISHEEEAAPAIIGEMLAARGVAIQRHVVLPPDGSTNTAFPPLADYDLVVAFGSFHNAYDPAAQDWVGAEIELIRDTMATETPYLGICFGGQLLGLAVGGSVAKAPDANQEVGVVQIQAKSPAWQVPSGPWFAWHEDRITLPDDPRVEVLADNENAVQAFRCGSAVGLQFHPEVDRALVADWLRIGEHHLPAHWTSAQLMEVWAAAEPEAHRNCEQLVDWVLAEMVGHRVGTPHPAAPASASASATAATTDSEGVAS